MKLKIFLWLVSFFGGRIDNQYFKLNAKAYDLEEKMKASRANAKTALDAANKIKAIWE